MTQTKFRVPHTLVLLFGMIVLAQLATYVLPAGSFQRVENEHGREEVVPGTYDRIPDAESVSPLASFAAIPTGFAEAQDIIFFVFIVGGAFGVFRAAGAADAAIGLLLARFGRRPNLLLAGGMLVFAVGSSTIGMAEEYMPFVPMLVALCLALGYDTVTAVGILCVGYGVGYGAAAINPFTVLIAQEVAQVEPSSGLGYRLVLFVVFFLVGYHHLWKYARMVKADPAASYVAGIEPPSTLHPEDIPDLRPSHVASIVLVLGAIGVLVWGIKVHGWYLAEMGVVFLVLAVLIAAAGRVGPSRAAQEFCVGAAELTTTALLIGFARSIKVVLDEGQVVDTIIHGIAQPLQSLGSTGAAIGMYFVQSVINFFIPSGSGQAYVTMPLMAPLGDLVGVERQVAVLAYQFGDGFTNIMIPTSAVLVGILAMANVPYDRWLKFVFPFMVKVWVVGSVALAVAVWIGYS